MMLNPKSLSPTLSRAKFSPLCRSSSCIDTILSHRHHDAATFNTSRNTVNHRALFYSSLTTNRSQHQHQLRLPKTRLPTRHNFTYAGPRKLGDVLKIEQIQDKSKVEISDLWMTYHEGKEKVHGLILDGVVGKRVLGRAAQWWVPYHTTASDIMFLHKFTMLNPDCHPRFLLQPIFHPSRLPRRRTLYDTISIPTPKPFPPRLS